MSTDLMIILSVVEPAVLALCLAVGLFQVGKRLEIISDGLGTLGGALATVESQHLRPLFKLVAPLALAAIIGLVVYLATA